jgi:hypothetical protein
MIRFSPQISGRGLGSPNIPVQGFLATSLIRQQILIFLSGTCRCFATTSGATFARWQNQQ